MSDLSKAQIERLREVVPWRTARAIAPVVAAMLDEVVLPVTALPDPEAYAQRLEDSGFIVAAALVRGAARHTSSASARAALTNRDFGPDSCDNGATTKDGPERRANAVIPGPCRLTRGVD